MTNNKRNGHGSTASDDFTGFTYELEEPITEGFSVTYDRKFNTGNFESLNPAITIWVKSNAPEGEAFGLHDAKERLRRMARENVRAQLLRQQGSTEVVFLGLQPPQSGGQDPIFIRTVSVSLVYKVNLGNDQSITPGYTDWADVPHQVAHSPGELHMPWLACGRASGPTLKMKSPALRVMVVQVGSLAYRRLRWRI